MARSRSKSKYHPPTNDMVHYQYMADFAAHPDRFGLDPHDIEAVIIEPVWYKHNGVYCSNEKKSLCDIIFLLQGNQAVPMEVKKSRHKRSKGIDQILYGWEYSKDILQRDCSSGIIGYYRMGKIDYETYRFFNGRVELL